MRGQPERCRRGRWKTICLRKRLKERWEELRDDGREGGGAGSEGGMEEGGKKEAEEIRERAAQSKLVFCFLLFSPGAHKCLPNTFRQGRRPWFTAAHKTNRGQKVSQAVTSNEKMRPPPTAAFFHFLLIHFYSPPLLPRSILILPLSLCHPSVLLLSPLCLTLLALQLPSVTALVLQAQSHVSGLLEWGGVDLAHQNVIVNKAALGIDVSRQVQHGKKNYTLARN